MYQISDHQPDLGRTRYDLVSRLSTKSLKVTAHLQLDGRHPRVPMYQNHNLQVPSCTD